MLTFDLECTNLDYGSALNADNKVVLVAWQVDDGPVKYFYGPLVYANAFWRDWAQAKDVCAQYAKFEMLWLLRHGVDILDKRWHDPMLAERVLLGNRTKSLSLDALAKRHGIEGKDPLADTLIKQGICPSKIAKKVIVARCIRDVRTTSAILKKQMALLGRRHQSSVYRTRADICPILAHMEWAGLELDPDRVKAAYVAANEDAARLKAQLDELTGGINLRSPDQMAHYLYGELGFPERVGANGKPKRNKPSKQFPDGRPLTDKHTLAWLASQATTPKQREFIELRKTYGKVASSLSKNLDFFQGVCEERNGRFYGQLNQCVAATHRLTSTGLPLTFSDGKTRSVQFQNMPREFKPLFKAPDGYYMVEVDLAGIEFRVAAFVAQDEQAMRDLLDPDFDPHVTSASVMQNIPYRELLDRYRAGDSIAKGWRQTAKSDTFKPLYGGEKGTPQQERWYKAFRERYKGIAATQSNWLQEVVANHGELRTPWGMRFYWETYEKHGILFDARKRKPVKPQVANYPIQNLATGEITPIAICALVRRCRQMRLDVTWMNTVHDSVVCLVRKEHIDDFKKAVQKAFIADVYVMLKRRYGLDFNVPLGFEMVYGSYWGEGESFAKDDARPGT